MTTKPTRILPDADGHEPTPTAGGRWVRDLDGGLTPADAQTAHAAGLAWGEDANEAPAEDAAAPAAPAVDAPADTSAEGAQPQE
jgi:hypothetical protein